LNFVVREPPLASKPSPSAIPRGQSKRKTNHFCSRLHRPVAQARILLKDKIFFNHENLSDIIKVIQEIQEKKEKRSCHLASPKYMLKPAYPSDQLLDNSLRTLA
jgi:hypothetical protein